VRFGIDVAFVPHESIPGGFRVLFGLGAHEQKIILLMPVRVPIQFQWHCARLGVGENIRFGADEIISAIFRVFLRLFGRGIEMVGPVQIPIHFQRNEVGFVGGGGGKACQQQGGQGE